MPKFRSKPKKGDAHSRAGSFEDLDISQRAAELSKHKLSLELAIAREIKEPDERALALCKLASHHLSMGSDPSPLLVEALLSADSVEDDLKKGVVLVEIACFFKSSGNDPLPLLSQAVSHIARSPHCGLVKDALFIRIGSICMELRNYDAALDAIARVSDSAAKAVVLTMVQAERAKAFSLD